MKKLMFAAAAAFCGTVFGLESANVVGYSNDSVAQGKYKVICNQFQTIGVDAANMTLGDFVPGGDWSSADKLKIFKDNSAVEMEVMYIDKTTADALAAAGLSVTPGWYDLKDSAFAKNLNTKPIPMGTSVMAYTVGANAYITFSGQVVTTEDGKITFGFTQGKYAMIGNCTPSPLTLGDFAPGGDWSSADKLKIFKNNSAVEMEVMYIDKATADALAAAGLTVTPGWYDLKDSAFATNLNSRPVAAGEGFMAYTVGAKATISIPTAL